MNVMWNELVQTAWDYSPSIETYKDWCDAVTYISLGVGFVSTCGIVLKALCKPRSTSLSSFSKQIGIPKTGHQAAAIGNILKLHEFLLRKDPDTVDENGMTPLMHAARNGHKQAVQFLLEMEANPNLITAKGETALHLAIANNANQAAELLVEKKAPVNIQDQDGKTPAMCALEGGNYPLFKQIAEIDSLDPATCDNFGRNTLHYAAKTRRSDVIMAVPNREQLKQLVDQNGNMPIDLLCGAGEISLKEFDELYFSEVFETLEKKKQDLQKAFACLSDQDKAAIKKIIESKFDSKCYMKAIEDPLYHESGKIYPLGLALLKISKKPLNPVEDCTSCVDLLGPLTDKALFIAVSKGKKTIVEKALKNRNFDPNLCDKDGTPLALYALRHGAFELAEKCAQFLGFDPSLTDAGGNTIVHAAAEAGNMEFIRKYGESYANLSNRKGQIPLEIAVKEGQLSCVELLVERTDVKKLQSIWKEEGLTSIEYAVVTGSESLRKALNKRGIFFKYDQKPERFYPTFINQFLKYLSLFEDGLGLKTAELSKFKEEAKAYLQGNLQESSEFFSQMLLGFKHHLERAEVGAKFREKKQEDPAAATIAQGFNLLYQSSSCGLKSHKILPFLYVFNRELPKEGRQILKNGLPMHPLFELFQTLLSPILSPILDKKTPFRELVRNNKVKPIKA